MFGLVPDTWCKKLYGSGVAFSLPNAHCKECIKYSVPCTDSTKNMTPHWHCQIQLHLKRRKFDWWALFRDIYGDGSMCLVIRALPAGKILYIVYGYPLVVGILTLLLYPVLKKKFQNSEKVIISNLFPGLYSGFFHS